MSDFDIIDNNEFIKPTNYKNTNNSSSSEVYNKFDIFKNSENESDNENENESENERLENQSENEISEFSDSEETNNNYVYVLSINNFPYFVFQNKKQAKEKIINLTHYYIQKLTDEYEYSYNIRLGMTNEEYIISKSYKYFIFNYEEKMLSLKYNKVKSNLNI